jgi:GNAT superfamily N-acetyltransferase
VAREIIAISDSVEENLPLLLGSETLHRELRPGLPASYSDYMRRMFSEGAEMAVLLENGSPKSLAVYRCHHTTFHGFRFYVDDLVTGEAERGSGYGAALLSWCEARARERGCDTFALDSGVHRQRAHRFYFRHGLAIFAFSFTKALR